MGGQVKAAKTESRDGASGKGLAGSRRGGGGGGKGGGGRDSIVMRLEELDEMEEIKREQRRVQEREKEQARQREEELSRAAERRSQLLSTAPTAASAVGAADILSRQVCLSLQCLEVWSTLEV